MLYCRKFNVGTHIVSYCERDDLRLCYATVRCGVRRSRSPPYSVTPDSLQYMDGEQQMQPLSSSPTFFSFLSGLLTLIHNSIRV